MNDGNHTKFKKLDEDYPLLAFADDCLRHMQQHGLDTVFVMELVEKSCSPTTPGVLNGLWMPTSKTPIVSVMITPRLP